VALVRTDVSDETISFIIIVTRISAVGTTLAVKRDLRTPMTEAIHSSERSVLTRATLRHDAENGILQSPHRENFKYYKSLL
jgi:hypothetical protein